MLSPRRQIEEVSQADPTRPVRIVRQEAEDGEQLASQITSPIPRVQTQTLVHFDDIAGVDEYREFHFVRNGQE